MGADRVLAPKLLQVVLSKPVQANSVRAAE